MTPLMRRRWTVLLRRHGAPPFGACAMTPHSLLRSRHGHTRVTYVELFFDLVFVFAVTQLSHSLGKHLDSAAHCRPCC
jgi:low temperature requirement protein LtrA